MRAAMTRRSQVHSMDDADNLEDLDSPESLVAALAIQTDDDVNAAKTDLWQRPENIVTPEPALPEDGTSVLRFKIRQARLMPPEGECPKAKRYVIYNVCVCLDSLSGGDAQCITIGRRYTDFRTLYLRLRNEHQEEKLSVSFPSKVLMGNFSSDLIAQRSSAFEEFLYQIVNNHNLRHSSAFQHFLQDLELTRACQLLEERRNEAAIPILEDTFLLLNKIFMDRSRPVLLLLCRLVAACTTSPVPHHSAERWASLALSRYETLCDIDLLPLYIPLLHTCAHLWWQRGIDRKPITDRLMEMSKKGIDTKNAPTLMQAIHKLDPRTETM